jgi:ABC-type transport system substrate-binding protein
VLLAGPAGIGKSRLIDELEELAHSRGMRSLRGRVSDSGQAQALGAFYEVLQEYMRVDPQASESLDAMYHRLVHIFPMLGEVASLRPTQVKEASGVEFTDARGPEARSEVFEALAAALARVASRYPVLLRFEDLHAGDVSVEAIEYVYRHLIRLPVLIIGTYHPEQVDRQHAVNRLLQNLRGDSRFSQLELQPLGQPEQRELVGQMLGGHVDPALTDQLYELAEGNPYYTIETVRSLRSSGALCEDNAGIWRLAVDSDSLADLMPKTLQDAVLRRVDALTPEARDVLTSAAVIGRQFLYRDLERLEPDRDNLEALVEVLIEEELLVEDRRAREDLLSFASSMVREAVYGQLGRRRRRALHRRYAEALEADGSSRRARNLAQLVHHFARADVAEKVFEYAPLLAREALERWGAEDAIRATRLMLEFVEDDAAAEGEARDLLARALAVAGDLSTALKEQELAHAAWLRAGDARRAATALATAAELAWGLHRSEEARRWVKNGIAAARSAGATDALLRLLRLGATVAGLSGDIKQAEDYRQEADALEPAADLVTAGQRRGGILRAALAGTLVTVDPCHATYVEESECLSMVFEPLLRAGADSRIRPWLASSLTVEDEGRSYRFRLRDDVLFHDGRPLTAHDVLATFERLLREGPSGFRWLLGAVAGADALLAGTAGSLAGFRIEGPYDFVVELVAPLGIFPAMLSSPAAGILPREFDPHAPDWRGGLVGTGPFRVSHVEPGVEITLQRNPHYWRKPYPRLDGLSLLSISAAERATAIHSEAASIVWLGNAATTDALLREPAVAAGLRHGHALVTYAVIFNSRSGPLADESLRRRMVRAIDVETVVHRRLGGAAAPARTFTPPELLGYDPLPRLGASLSETTAQPVCVELKAAATGSIRSGVIEDTLEAWRNRGIDVRFVAESWDGYVAARREGTVDLLVAGWQCDYPDADDMLFTTLHSKAGVFARYVGCDELDALCDRGRRETDPDQRREIYREIEEVLERRALLLPLYHPRHSWYFRRGVEGVELNLFFPMLSWEKLSLG